MIDIDDASSDDIDDLIDLESALFAEDGAQHDPYADPTWPRREGRQDFEDLMASPDSVLLVARAEGRPVGFLAGYSSHSSPTRQPVRYAVLRSLYVAADWRRSGAATKLTERFLEWARERGCAEAHVDHYAANTGAGHFYARLGFSARSISRALPLEDAASLARTAFAGGDQSYLRDEQYGTSANLDARAALHQRFSTAPVSLPSFEGSLVDWRADHNILECGSGTGLFWTNPHTPRSVTATLTDLSPGMVETAVAQARANGFENISGHECDVQDLPFDDNTFDVVVANHMLYHVPDPDQAVAELARVLRPDGQLVAATNGHGHMDAMTDTIEEVFGASPNDLYDVFGINSGEARLRRRFSSITWHAYSNDLLVDDPDAAVAYGLSFPPGDTATEAQAAEFRQAIESRFADGVLRIRTRSGVFICSGPLA